MENTRKYYLFTDTQLEIINSRMISNRAGLCLDHVHDHTTVINFRRGYERDPTEVSKEPVNSVWESAQIVYLLT